jgi:capsular exopolysaccharide synthesis family protein
MDTPPNGSPAVALPEERIAHLRDYWRIVWRHRWTVLAIFAGTLLLTTVVTFLKTPVYRASATVEVQTQSRRATSGPDVSGLGASGYGWSAEERFYSTQIEILRSHDMGERVLKALSLREDPAFREVKDPAAALSRMVEVSLRKDTGIVEIAMSGSDPVRAAELANGYAQQYVQRNLEIARDGVKQLVGEMRKQLDPIKGDIEKAERRRFETAQKEELFVPENQKSIVEENLRTYSEDLQKTRGELAEVQATLKVLESLQQGADPSSAISLRRISEDSEIQTLVGERNRLEQELQQKLVKFRPGSPDVRETQSKIDVVNGRMADRMRIVASALRAELGLLTAKASNLQARMDESRQESFDVGRKTSENRLNETDTESSRKVYDSLLQSVGQISLQSSLLNNNLTILDRAVVPTAPIRPNKPLNLIIGAIVGVFLGVGASFFIDYLDNTIKSATDIEQFLKLPLLAMIPRFRETTGHAVKEAYQTLRTSVLFSSRGRQNRILMMTSAGPREGKTCTIVNLARTIANAGERVILLDCDLRRPKVHEDLGLTRDGGLTNYLAGSATESYREFVKETDQPNLSVLTCGPIPPNPPELFGSDKFRALLATLKKDYDWVFVDTPPVASVTDAVILASLVEMVGFVVKHNGNERELIRRSLNSIRTVNPNVIGAVLNNVDIERGGTDYYYTGYYYTAEGEDEGEGKRRPRRTRPQRQHTGAGNP